MENLKWLREQGEMMNQEEYDRFIPLTIEESVAEFLFLYRTFFFLRDRFPDLDRKEDDLYFTEISRRLKRVKRTKHENPKSISQRRAVAKAS